MEADIAASSRPNNRAAMPGIGSSSLGKKRNRAMIAARGEYAMRG